MNLPTMYLEAEDSVAQLVLNRPTVLNCADEQWVRDLNAVADHLATDGRVRVVVVRGAGRAFCSGIDLTALSRGEIRMEFFSAWERALRKFESMDKVFISAVHSHCLGGGMQLALACDLRVAREDARFGVTAAREGIIPGMGMWRIARFAGLGRAKRLILTADVIDAATALQWGLVDWVVPEAEFESCIRRQVDRVLSMRWTSARLSKKLANMAFDVPFGEFLQSYVEFQRQSIQSEEHRQAMADHRGRKRKEVP